MKNDSRIPKIGRKVRRVPPVPQKYLFDVAKTTINKSILMDEPFEEVEIDISNPYDRSTKVLGDYVTLDWRHIQDIRKLIKAIRDYSQDQTLLRPLNIIMLAQPGTGKSFFIKCLANKMDYLGISAVTYNMATMENMADLIQPLEAVRNLKVIDRLPILFLDEFDSNPKNYQLLLPLLWDGEIHVGHRDLKLGKVIIIIAGSNPEISKVMKAAKNMKKDLTDDNIEMKTKLVDLLSRINGGLFEIPELDIEKGDRDRRVDKVCITISLLKQRFGENLQLVPWCLLRFVGLNKFRYGVRSLAHLIDRIPWNPIDSGMLNQEDLQLPLMSRGELKNSSLAYHLIAEEESEDIVAMWKEILQNKILVRFIQKEENRAVG